jgi:REP element-mobilizing transposase RayT
VPGIHHVFARGNDQRRIFRTDADREDYLAILERVIERLRWRCLTYCLMDNHIHLLVEIGEASLGAGMQRLHGLYAANFNQRHGRSGHLFQGRYGSTLVRSDPQLWWTIAYIVHNPVQAGLCRSPDAWPWSSHRAVIEDAGPGWLDRTRLLECFEDLGGAPRRRYRQLTAAAAPS